MIELLTIGGYNEVGKNCTAIKVDNEVVIFDMGIHLEKYIDYTENDENFKVSPTELIRVGAIPNINRLKDWAMLVKAIIPTHAHLDHVGAIPYLAERFDAPILCTPFTGAVINTLLKDDKKKIPNEIIIININSRFRISNNLEIEFVNITHSTPHTIMAVLHTKYGSIIYANDFKFDNFPILGKTPNYDRLKELGQSGVIALIVDSIYANLARKTPSETVAKSMLKDVMLNIESDGKAMIVTTFSSHIARLKSIIEFGKQLNRKIIFLGRSLSKYTQAAEDVGLVKFSDEVEIVRFGKQVKKKLRDIAKNKDKYLIVCTGHQGEPNAVLTRIATRQYDFKLGYEDIIIFSSTVIPTKVNQDNREKLEAGLKETGVRIFRDIHQSGHASREDLRDLINMVHPKNIIPAHGNHTMESGLAELATEMGYTPGKDVFLMQDFQKITLKP